MDACAVVVEASCCYRCFFVKLTKGWFEYKKLSSVYNLKGNDIIIVGCFRHDTRTFLCRSS